MAIRFSQADARAMGRNTSGVRGIKLRKDDEVIGMVVADPAMTLLTMCEKGYGKRTPFGFIESVPVVEDVIPGEDGVVADEEIAEALPEETDAEEATGEEGEESSSSSRSYRRQRRGGMGVRDIRVIPRNGKVVKILAVQEGDHVLIVTAGGKIQRVRAAEISEIGRNTQGVRVIKLTEGDRVASMARIPADLCQETIEEKLDIEPKAQVEDISADQANPSETSTPGDEQTTDSSE